MTLSMIVGKDLVSTSGHIHGCCGQDFSLIWNWSMYNIGLITQDEMEDLNAGYMPRLTPTGSRGSQMSSEMHPHLNSLQDTQAGGAHQLTVHSHVVLGFRTGREERGRLSNKGIPMNQVGTEQSMFGEQKGSYVVRIG